MEKLKEVVMNAKVDEENKEEVSDDAVPFDLDDEDDIIEDVVEEIDEDAIITLDDDRLNAIRAAFKASDAGVKAEVKKYLVNYDNKLKAEMKRSDVDAIESVLGLSEEV